MDDIEVTIQVPTAGPTPVPSISLAPTLFPSIAPTPSCGKGYYLADDGCTACGIGYFQNSTEPPWTCALCDAGRGWRWCEDEAGWEVCRVYACACVCVHQQEFSDHNQIYIHLYFPCFSHTRARARVHTHTIKHRRDAGFYSISVAAHACKKCDQGKLSSADRSLYVKACILSPYVDAPASKYRTWQIVSFPLSPQVVVWRLLCRDVCIE